MKLNEAVSISVGTEPPRAALVLRIGSNPANAKPVLDLAVGFPTHDDNNLSATRVNEVPHVSDSPEGHYRWDYATTGVLAVVDRDVTIATENLSVAEGQASGEAAV